MSLFKQNLYKVVWAYETWLNPTTEIVKARDMGHAWEKVRKEHSHWPITLIAMEKIEDNNYFGKGV